MVFCLSIVFDMSLPLKMFKNITLLLVCLLGFQLMLLSEETPVSQPLMTDLEAVQYLSLSERMRLADADEKIKKGHSDIESGNWMLSAKKDEKRSLGTDVEVFHKQGQELLDKGKKAVAQGMQMKRKLLLLAQSRKEEQERKKESLKAPDPTTYTWESSSLAWDVLESTWTGEVMEKLWEKGYRRIAFLGAYRSDTARPEKLNGLTERWTNLFKTIDKDRYSFEQSILEQLSLTDEGGSVVIHNQGNKNLNTGLIVLECLPNERTQSVAVQLQVVDQKTMQLIDCRYVRIPLEAQTAKIMELPVSDKDTVQMFSTAMTIVDELSFIKRMNEASAKLQYRIDFEEAEPLWPLKSLELKERLHLMLFRQCLFEHTKNPQISYRLLTEILPIQEGVSLEKSRYLGDLHWKIQTVEDQPNRRDLSVYSVAHRKLVPVGHYQLERR